MSATQRIVTWLCKQRWYVRDAIADHLPFYATKVDGGWMFSILGVLNGILRLVDVVVIAYVDSDTRIGQSISIKRRSRSVFA
jgi:hypothetical protein